MLNTPKSKYLEVLYLSISGAYHTVLASFTHVHQLYSIYASAVQVACVATPAILHVQLTAATLLHLLCRTAPGAGPASPVWLISR